MARERERVVQGATQGDVLVLRDLTKVGWGPPLLGWGASTGLPTFLMDFHPPRCTLGRGHQLLTACAWGFPLVR